IFEPFFTTKEVGKGTGLGLSTVYGIVHQSGGHIAVDTAPGRGTVFKIYFPRFSGEVDTPAAVAAIPTGQSQTILLVEDEPGVRTVARDILQSIGYQVLEAASPSAALEIARGQIDSIDLLLTDVVMPAMNGRELAERLLAQRRDLPVLYMSGYSVDVVLRGEGGAVTPP